MTRLGQLSIDYGQLMSEMRTDDPQAADTILRYVGKLREEAAGYRREAHRLRCTLEAQEKR